MLKIFRKFFDFCGGVNKKKFYRSIFCGVLLAFFEAIKIPAIILMLQGVIEDNVTSSRIFACFLIIFVSLVLSAVIRNRCTMLQCEAGYDTAAEKRMQIAEHMRYLPMGYFNKNSLGYITSVTTNTMEQLADVATRVVMLTTQGILTSVLIAAVILVYDWRIGIAVTVGIVLFFVVNSVMQNKSKTIAPQKAQVDSKLVEGVLEYVQGISEVKSYNLTGKMATRLNNVIDENSDYNVKMEMSFVPLVTLQNIVIKLTGVVMALMSIIFYLNGTMELMISIGMMICAFMVFSSLEQAGSYSALLRSVDVAVDRAQEILDIPPMDIDGKDIQPDKYDIELENVKFSYDEKEIISGISLKIPQKTTTAIVGPSGGGKTTLCHLIARFWDIDSGKIKLGGTDIKEYSMDSLMKNFSFVFQNVYLFQDTVANNIRFGQPDAPMEKVIDAAKMACCHDFIMSLPNGYDTVIGEGGASLSGGEKQRISIARAIMKNAPIIILDEATANVDPENEKDLITAIDALTREKTILMIAHRLKTVRNADRIIVVDNGNIVEQGKHDELMKQDGIYKRFVNAREIAAGWKI